MPNLRKDTHLSILERAADYIRELHQENLELKRQIGAMQMSKGLVLPTPPPANTPRVVDSSAYVDSSDSSFTVTTTNPNTPQLTQPPQQQQPQQSQQQPVLVSTSFLMDSMQAPSPLPATLAPPPLTPAPSLAEDTTTRVPPFVSSTPFPSGGFTGTSTALPPLGQQGAPFTLPSIVEFPIQPGFSLSYNNPPTMTPQPQQGTPSTIQHDALSDPDSPFIKFSATPPATPQTVTSTNNPNQNQFPPITTNDPSNPTPPGHDEVVSASSCS